MKKPFKLMKKERRYQLVEKGFTPEWDDQWVNEELVIASRVILGDVGAYLDLSLTWREITNNIKAMPRDRQLAIVGTFMDAEITRLKRKLKKDKGVIKKSKAKLKPEELNVSTEKLDIDNPLRAEKIYDVDIKPSDHKAIVEDKLTFVKGLVKTVARVRKVNPEEWDGDRLTQTLIRSSVDNLIQFYRDLCYEAGRSHEWIFSIEEMFKDIRQDGPYDPKIKE